jgi:hypothetical protein
MRYFEYCVFAEGCFASKCRFLDKNARQQKPVKVQQQISFFWKINFMGGFPGISRYSHVSPNRVALHQQC